MVMKKISLSVFAVPLFVFLFSFNFYGKDKTKLSDIQNKSVGTKYFENIQLIDHWNLRYHKRYDVFTLKEQVEQIKSNMDVAAELDFNSYLLFQKDAFKELLSWGGKHDPDIDLQKAVKEIISYGKQRGLDVFLHSNQFLWPENVGINYEDSEKAWQVYESAIHELIKIFPDVAGYQVTGDETEGQLDSKEGLLKFHNLTARALKSDGKERLALMRTWQRCGFLGIPEKELGVGDEQNLIYSIKNTSGDFNIIHPFDSAFIKPGVDGSRLLIEFDAWREYETHNIFPLYLGDYWAPRFRKIADMGIKNVGLRFNWNSGRFHITDIKRPYANWVNVYAFYRLVQNPYENPDDILMDFCHTYFPEEPVAAFRMYKNTFAFANSIYYKQNELFLHHGGLKRPRGNPVNVTQVNAAFVKMKKLIDKIPDTNQYKTDLQKYARIIFYLGSVAAGDTTVLDDWRRLDMESFKELEAGNGGIWTDLDQ